MPRTKEQNEALRKMRMEAILDGALKVYVDKGYSATEIGDIAQEANVARGLIYYYYKDKRTLFRALFVKMFETSNAYVHEHFEQNGSVYDLLEEYAKSMYHRVVENSYQVRFFTRMRHDMPQLYNRDEIMQTRWHPDNSRIMVEAMQRGVDKGEIRKAPPQLLAGQFNGALLSGMMYLLQRNRDLRESGMTPEQIVSVIADEANDAVAACMAIVSPKSTEIKTERRGVLDKAFSLLVALQMADYDRTITGFFTSSL